MHKKWSGSIRCLIALLVASGLLTQKAHGDDEIRSRRYELFSSENGAYKRDNRLFTKPRQSWDHESYNSRHREPERNQYYNRYQHLDSYKNQHPLADYYDRSRFYPPEYTNFPQHQGYNHRHKPSTNYGWKNYPVERPTFRRPDYPKHQHRPNPYYYGNYYKGK